MDDDKLKQEIDALARHFAAAPTKGLARSKQAIYASSSNTLEEQLNLERDFMRELGYSQDYREGVAAFKLRWSDAAFARLQASHP